MQGTRSIKNSIKPRKDWNQYIGQEYDTNSCGKAIIVKAHSNKEIVIKYINTGNTSIVRYDNLVRGKCIDPMAPIVYGKGYLGVGAYNSINCKSAYQLWANILQRCPITTGTHTKLPYQQCRVCNEWLNFQNFATWYIANYREGYQIDKDLIYKGNTIYSPETCCMIPMELNQFLVRRKTERNIAIGVVKHRNCYVSRCNDPFLKKGKYLGCYPTIEEAFNAYKHYKEMLFKLMAAKYKDAISNRAYQALLTYQVEITD